MESLKQSAAAGVRWSALSAVISAGLQAAQIFVLAQLLDPEEYGLMAMAMVMVAFIQTIVELGISPALVYRQDATVQQMSSLFALSIAAGAVGFVLALICTPLCVWFFQARELWILPLCALTFLLGPAGQQYAALLQKNLRFRALGLAEIASQTTFFGVAVFLAWRGAGVMALVWALLAATLLRTVLMVQAGLPLWRPAFYFRVADLHGFLRFGVYQTASGILNFALMRMDQVLLGRWLGKAVLGQYNFAYNLVMQPLLRINPVLTRVAFPVFARLQNEDEKLRAVFCLMSRALLTVNAPLLLGLASVMHDTIGVIFQPKWADSVRIVEVLAFVTLFRSIGNPIGSLVLAKGRADLEFKWNVLVVVCQLVAVWAGARLGQAVGVAIGLLAVQVVLFVLCYGLLLRPLVGSCLSLYLRNLAAPVLPALAMGAALVALPDEFAGLPRAVSLVLEILFGATMYAGLLWAFQRDFLREGLAMFRLG